MYRISKKFNFEASHQLEGLPEGHQCGRLHGHSYEVEVTFCGRTLASEEWLFDFAELKPFKDFLDQHYDHRHLNGIAFLGQPTSENLARHFYDVIQDMFLNGQIGSGTVDGTYLEKVRVSETAKTYAEYFGV